MRNGFSYYFRLCVFCSLTLYCGLTFSDELDSNIEIPPIYDSVNGAGHPASRHKAATDELWRQRKAKPAPMRDFLAHPIKHGLNPVNQASQNHLLDLKEAIEQFKQKFAGSRGLASKHADLSNRHWPGQLNHANPDTDHSVEKVIKRNVQPQLNPPKSENLLNNPEVEDVNVKKVIKKFKHDLEIKAVKNKEAQPQLQSQNLLNSPEAEEVDVKKVIKKFKHDLEIQAVKNKEAHPHPARVDVPSPRRAINIKKPVPKQTGAFSSKIETKKGKRWMIHIHRTTYHSKKYHSTQWRNPYAYHVWGVKPRRQPRHDKPTYHSPKWQTAYTYKQYKHRQLEHKYGAAYFGRQISYVPRLSAGPFYQTGGGGSFGLYDLFAPFTFDSRTIMFVDGRYIQRAHSWEYNLGLGVRNILHNDKYLWTLYAFYDTRRTRFANYFGQVTVGGDLQTEKWYFNTNAYIPVGNSQGFVNEYNTAYLCQNNTRICYARGVEKSMGGWDGDFGYEILPKFRAYFGFYVFARANVKTAVGPNLRLQYDLQYKDERRILYVFDKIALLTNWRYDQLSKSVWYIGARFDISIGPRPKYVGLERKMTSFIRRDLNVEMSSDGSGENAAATEPVKVLTNEFDGQETQVALIPSSTSDANFNTAVANVRNNIFGIEGTVTTTSTKTLQNNQILEGGVYSFTREGANFSVQVGQSGRISRNNVAGFALVTVGSAANVGQNNTIENMDFDDVGAVAGTDVAIRNITNNPVGNLSLLNNSMAAGYFLLVDIGTSTADSTIEIKNNTVTGGVGAVTQGLVNIIGSTGATGATTVQLDGNNFTSTTVNSYPLNLRAATGTAVLYASLTNNTFTANGDNDVQLFSPGNAHLVITGNIEGNSFINNRVGAQGVALDIGLGGSITLLGDISNNIIVGRGTAVNNGLFFIGFTAGGAAMRIYGSIHGNTITNNAATFPALDIIAENDSSLNINGGINNNVINAGAGAGILTDTRTGANIVIQGMSGNTITNFAANRAIVTNQGSTGVTNIVLGTGVSGTVANLAAGNGLAAGDITLNDGGGTTYIIP